MTGQVTCECGLVVKGVSKSHAEANLKQHRKSKIHKKIMKLKEEEENKGGESPPPNKLQDKNKSS